MGLALLVVIWFLTFAGSYFFVAKTWWWPVAASLSGPSLDAQFQHTLIAMGIVFVAAQAGLGLFAWLYREPEETRTLASCACPSAAMDENGSKMYSRE